MTHITHSNFLTHHDTTGSQEIFNYEFYLLIMILQILESVKIPVCRTLEADKEHK